MGELVSAERWSRLLNTIEALKSATTMGEVIESVRSTARAIVGADGITIVRRIGQHVHYVAEDAISPLWTGHHFPIEQCVSGLAILTHSPILISDIKRDPRVPYHLYAETFVGSMAMFPIGMREPVAAMGAYWQNSGPIPEETIKLMESLARAMGTVLYNLDLIEAVTEYRAVARRGWGTVAMADAR